MTGEMGRGSGDKASVWLRGAPEGKNFRSTLMAMGKRCLRNIFHQESTTNMEYSHLGRDDDEWKDGLLVISGSNNNQSFHIPWSDPLSV